MVKNINEEDFDYCGESYYVEVDSEGLETLQEDLSLNENSENKSKSSEVFTKHVSQTPQNNSKSLKKVIGAHLADSSFDIYGSQAILNTLEDKAANSMLGNSDKRRVEYNKKDV